MSVLDARDEVGVLGVGRGGSGGAGSKYCTAPERVVNSSATPIQAIDETGSSQRPHRTALQDIG